MFERLEKMDRRTLVVIVVAVVAGLMLFGGIAGGIRQAGWNEGFLMGQLSSGVQQGTEAGQAAVNPYLAARGYGMHGWGGHGWGWHPFGLIGGFFRFLFFGFLLLMLFKFLAFRRWAHHAGYRGGHGPWGYHGGHHGRHPWSTQEEATQGTPQPQAQPDPTPASDPDAMKGPQNTSWTQV